jgi:hypothetical protein
MVRNCFATSPSYSQYLCGIRDIHALIAVGRDDSPEADAIRDGMDHPWYDLSEAEQQRLKGLSADLYSISDPIPEDQPTNVQGKQSLTEADKARQAGDWDRALEILRAASRDIDPGELSSLRARIWREAGDETTAALFHEHAARIEATRPDFAIDPRPGSLP